jgi:hypothetical protein
MACEFETIREAKDETIEWLLWYNRTRMHSTLSYVSPMQFEQMESPENDGTVFRPSHKPWKSIKADSHIPTATTMTRMN